MSKHPVPKRATGSAVPAMSAVLTAWLVAGCVQISTGTDADAGSTTGSTSSDPATGSPYPTAVGCTQDPTGQIPLCSAVSSCPSITVDPGAFPQCGFRFDVLPKLDIECVCSDELCPLGSPTSCSDVTSLLASQTALTVCQGAAEGRCLPHPGADAGAGSTCTSLCRAECSGVPDCLQACGC